MSEAPDGGNGTGATGATGGATGATGGTNVGAGGGDQNQPWYTGLDAETIGYLQNRGLDKQDAKAAAIASIQAHRNAEKMLGAPADQMLRLPKDGNDPAWRSVWHKLGVPQDGKGYDFTDLKFADGSPLSDEFVGFLQNAFHTNNVPKSAAAGVARDVVKFLDGLGERGDANSAGEIAKQKDELKQNWGFNYNQNMLIAQNAARALGIDEETIQTLEGLKGVGYAKVMEMFRDIGEKIGEDKFFRSPAPGGKGPMTTQQATARLAELKRDTQWVTKLNAGDTEVVREFNSLTEIIAAARGQRFE